MTCWYPDLAERVLEGLYMQTRPSLEKFAEGAGYLPDWDVILMQITYCLEPTRLHPSLLIDRVPYTRPESFLERLMAAARRGWLCDEKGEFALTDAGREVVEGVYDLGDRLYAKIKALNNYEMQRLLFLSDCVINNIEKLPVPSRKPAFTLSLRFHRDRFTPLIVRVRQRIFDLLAFRDDAHITSWRPYEQDGRLWEAFTLVWREQVGSAAELYELLPHRNYSKSDYAAALDILAARGWIVGCEDRFVVQEQAAQIRQKIEEQTNLLFAAAFSGLSADEKRELQELMTKFADTVKLQAALAN